MSADKPLPIAEFLTVLREREAYLRQRVVAKQKVGWEFAYDEREADALAAAIERLT